MEIAFSGVSVSGDKPSLADEAFRVHTPVSLSLESKLVDHRDETRCKHLGSLANDRRDLIPFSPVGLEGGEVGG